MFTVRIRRIIATTVLLAFATAYAEAGLSSKKAAYFGGTSPAFAGAKDGVEGRLDTTNSDELIFTAEESPFGGKQVRIPYSDVIDLEYGQKAGRRVGAAVGYTILLGPLGLISLFSKKRKHYLTVGYKGGDGKDQVAIIELGKDLVRSVLPIVETRSGKKIEYQDEEAKKSAK